MISIRRILMRPSLLYYCFCLKGEYTQACISMNRGCLLSSLCFRIIVIVFTNYLFTCFLFRYDSELTCFFFLSPLLTFLFFFFLFDVPALSQSRPPESSSFESFFCYFILFYFTLFALLFILYGSTHPADIQS